MITVSLLKTAGIVSFFTFVVSLAAVPWLINRMPVDYFQWHWAKTAARRKQHPVASAVIFLLRNILGLALFTAGVAMLFLPGQGILTMVIGVCVMDFPGKRRFLIRILQRTTVRKALNWVRRKGGKPPFVFW